MSRQTLYEYVMEQLGDLEKPVKSGTECGKKRVRVSEADVIVEQTSRGLYYFIKYKEIGKKDYTIGYDSYGSHDPNLVFRWLGRDFEIIKEEKEKTARSEVDMDGLRTNILAMLLNARLECLDGEILTKEGCAAIIDALFYLVSGGR